MQIKSLVILLIVVLLFVAACSRGKITGGAVVDTTQKESSSDYNCQDDDNGQDPKKRAVVKLINNGEVTKRIDQCYKNILVEYYCDKDEIKNVNFNCVNKELNTGICDAGKCK